MGCQTIQYYGLEGNFTYLNQMGRQEEDLYYLLVYDTSLKSYEMYVIQGSEIESQNAPTLYDKLDATHVRVDGEGDDRRLHTIVIGNNMVVFEVMCPDWSGDDKYKSHSPSYLHDLKVSAVLDFVFEDVLTLRTSI